MRSPYLQKITRSKSRRLEKVDLSISDCTDFDVNAIDKSKIQLLGPYKLDKTVQLCKLIEAANKDLYSIEYKDLGTKKLEKTARSIQIKFNSAAYLVIHSYFGNIHKDQLLGGFHNVVCKDIKIGKDLDNNNVHTKYVLNFDCNIKTCVHSVTLHLHNSTCSLQIQGNTTNHKNESCPHFYLKSIFQDFMDGILAQNLDWIINTNRSIARTKPMSTQNCSESKCPEEKNKIDANSEIENPLHVDTRTAYIFGTPGPATQELTRDMLNVRELNDNTTELNISKSSLQAHEVIDSVISTNCTNPTLNTPITTDNNLPLSQSCSICKALNKNSNKLMLHSTKEWNISLDKICQFANKAMTTITEFKPNLMNIGKDECFNKFNCIWANLIECMSNKRNKLQHICGQLVHIFPAIMLQKVSESSVENTSYLTQRLKKWEEGEFDQIMNETVKLQESIFRAKRKAPKKDKNDYKISFLKSIERGDIKAAALAVDPDNFGLNQWSDDVKNELKEKFPSNFHNVPNLPDNDTVFHSTKITAASVYRIISKARSKSGGIDHLGYGTLFKLCKLKFTGNILIQAITKLTNLLANTKIPNLEHFLSARCIPVKKKDGATRPVCVGNIIRRVSLKAIDIYHKSKIIANCPRQLSNGIKGGCEGIIHALRNVINTNKNPNFAILTLDATNAYNSIDRAKTLDNIYAKVPELYIAAYNTYGNTSYVMLNDERFPVEQGTSQGCPLASSFFNLGIAILIEKLTEFSELQQIWYADDGILYGHPNIIMKAWNYINTYGKTIGYSPNSKSIIYDVNANSKESWTEAGITYSSNGLEVLGSPIGDDNFIATYCTAKFEKIAIILDKLSIIAKSHPQQAWSVVNRSTKFKSSYIFRTTPSAHVYSGSYNEALEKFLTTIIGRNLDEKLIFQSLLPIGKGGLGLNIKASDHSDKQYTDSQMLSYNLTRHITHHEPMSLDSYDEIRNNLRANKKSFWDEKVNEFKLTIDDVHIKRLEEMQFSGSNHWLSCIPVSWKPEWSLPKCDFIDALNLRFNLIPTDTPPVCRSNNCSQPFTLAHMDICLNGGIITRRHDYVKSILTKYSGKAFGGASITVEPHLGELNEEELDLLTGNTSIRARADIAILDFNGTQKTTYIDVSVISPICDSHKASSIEKVLSKIEKKKNDSYAGRIKQHLGGDFFPFVLTSGGAIGPMAKKIINKIAEKISSSSYETKTDILSEIKKDLSTSLQKSRIQGLRANRNSILSQITNLRLSQLN